jgi:hypothetical protein
MPTYRLEATLSEDGKLTLSDLPFQAGQAVEVIVLPRAAGRTRENRYPLRGTPISYLDPIEPVAETDWESLR